VRGAQRVARQRINRIHYSISDVLGSSVFNARPYSLYQANPPKVSGWTEVANLNIGGPLKIPHVYDGSDKTFFYINFGGTWQRTPVDQFSTVPTLAERNGDFSADNVQLYNPLSNLNGPRALMSNVGCYQATPSSPLPPAGTCIPTNMISAQAIGLLNYIPTPNIPETTLGGRNVNFHLQTNLPGLSNRLNVNITHQISSKLSLQVNYNLSNATSHSLASFPGIEGNTFTRGQSAMIGLTQNWTKTFRHTSQFYFSRSRSLGLNEFSDVTNIGAQLGLTGISPNPLDYGLPNVGFTNFTGLNDPNFYLARSQTYRYVDSFRWMKEKHTITVGGEVRKLDINRDSDPLPNGQFSFILKLLVNLEIFPIGIILRGCDAVLRQILEHHLDPFAALLHGRIWNSHSDERHRRVLFQHARGLAEGVMFDFAARRIGRVSVNFRALERQ
jgi:hypothetical protein